MPAAGGPNTLGESNLVFAYDTGDTINSYRGEPTTNLIDPNAPNIYSWWTRNVQTITQLTETYKGQPIYRVSLSIDSGDMLNNITERWGGGSGWYMPYVMFNANTPYVASVIYRPVSHPDTRVYGHPSNIGGWGATVDGSTDIDNQWKIHRIDRNFENTVGDNRFYHMHTPSATLGQTVTVDITNSQIEQKNHSTPFVNGTRSATQGLLPLIGNSTLDLTNVSFDSNAKMVFDGTNDYISCGTLSLDFSQGITAEVVANFTNTGTWQRLFDFGNGAGSNNILFARYSSTNYLWFEIYNGGSSVSINTAGGIINNQTCHYVATVNGSIAYVYRDGVLINSGTFTTVPTTISRTNCYIGKSNWADSYFQGDIPVVKMYNRALTAQEVKQNYQQYKTRFKLL